MTVLYSLLGPVSVQVDDRELDLGPKKQRSLLALLLIHRNRTVATDRILEALWGEDAVGKENALWVYISRLRSILSEVSSDEILVTRDRGYTIQVEPQSVDVDRFSELTSLGMSQLDSDPHEAADSLAQALAMWKGSPVEDFTYDEFAQTEINRLNTLRRNCLDARIDADLQIGRSGEVVSEIEQQVESRPYDETPVRQLVLALYRSGRQTEALRAFERFRRLIGENAGTEPSPELCRLEEQVLFHDPALGRRSTAASHANPYRGLEAFREEDASVFFGRDRLSAHLLTSLDEGPIVTLVGPSGSGKSSVMRSGVIPALRKGSLPGSDQWNIATMLPGSHPFVELEAALLRTRLDAPESLRGQLDGQSDEILRAALRIGVTEESVVVIMIDQFEELFTNCEPALAQRFLTAVVAATKDPRHRVRFLLTLRSDFYDRPLRHREFGIVMADGIVNIVPMAPEELEAAAAGPARNVGVRLEPALEAALIGDVLGEPGALPLFQFALTDLFDRRVGETLTLDAYRGMGGIEGAVSRKAEYLFDGLNQRQREATRQLFLRLVTITEGTSNSRRRVEASELLSLDLDAEDLQTVLVAFGEERLLSFDRSEITGSPTVEVAHEALLSRWDRLSEWIRNAQDDVKRNARLTTLADEWEDSSRDSAYLLAEGRYVQYADWAAESTMKLARPEIEFLAASATAHEERVEAETERAVRERASARRAKRNAWGLAAVISAVVLVSVSILWFASRPAGPTVAWVYPASEVGGVIHTSTRTGFEASERELGIEFLDVPIVQNPEETIRDVFDSGAELVVVSNDTSEIVLNVADDYPDARVLVIDTYWEYGPGVFTLLSTTLRMLTSWESPPR